MIHLLKVSKHFGFQVKTVYNDNDTMVEVQELKKKSLQFPDSELSRKIRYLLQYLHNSFLLGILSIFLSKIYKTVCVQMQADKLTVAMKITRSTTSVIATNNAARLSCADE